MSSQDCIKGKCAMEILSPNHLPGKAGRDEGGGYPKQSEQDWQRRHYALQWRAHTSRTLILTPDVCLPSSRHHACIYDMWRTAYICKAVWALQRTSHFQAMANEIIRACSWCLDVRQQPLRRAPYIAG